ncbi:hypothetical protein MRX96_005349 [Rhipicephalus microplus]
MAQANAGTDDGRVPRGSQKSCTIGARLEGSNAFFGGETSLLLPGPQPCNRTPGPPSVRQHVARRAGSESGDQGPQRVRIGSASPNEAVPFARTMARSVTEESASAPEPVPFAPRL